MRYIRNCVNTAWGLSTQCPVYLIEYPIIFTMISPQFYLQQRDIPNSKHPTNFKKTPDSKHPKMFLIPNPIPISKGMRRDIPNYKHPTNFKIPKIVKNQKIQFQYPKVWGKAVPKRDAREIPQLCWDKHRGTIEKFQILNFNITCRWEPTCGRHCERVGRDQWSTRQSSSPSLAQGSRVPSSMQGPGVN